MMSTVAVTIAIVDSSRVLLTRRRDVRFWCLPGGAVDDGETVAQAAQREAMEETGLEIELRRLVGIYSRPNWWDGGEHEILVSARVTGGQLKRETAETIDATYFAADEIPRDLLFWHRRRIRDALEERPAVLAMQDVGWPFGESTREEAYKLIKQGAIPKVEFEAFLRGESEGYVEELQIGEDISDP